MKRIAFAIATAGGAGLSPVAPGTAGSAVGLFLYLGIAGLSVWLQALIILLAFFVGLWASDVVEKTDGRPDDPRIVIDEVLGMWVTLWALPVSWFTFLAGFALFRAMDIVKPFPANWVDRKWTGARGVMCDDLVAGIYAQSVLRVLLRLGVLL